MKLSVLKAFTINVAIMTAIKSLSIFIFFRFHYKYLKEAIFDGLMFKSLFLKNPICGKIT